MTNLFTKTRVDRPYESEGALGKFTSVLDVRSKGYRCLSCCYGKEGKKPQEKDENEIQDKRRRSLTQEGIITSKAMSSRIVLKNSGYAALMSTKSQYRIPVFLNDVQRFLLLPIVNEQKYDYFTTKWIDIVKREEIKKTLVIVIEGGTLLNYRSFRNVFLNLGNGFQSCFEVLTNTVSGGNVIEELCIIPIFSTCHETFVRTYGCLDAAFNVINEKTSMLATVFPINQDAKSNTSNKNKDSFSRCKLTLDASQMVEEGFPIPVPGKLKTKSIGYKMTKEKYLPVNSTSPLFALACERCNRDNVKSGLYRITLIDEKYDVIYDSYVLPYNKITSKSTSELTRQMLLDIKTRIEEAHNHISRALTPDSILLGDSLQDDLHSLKLMHPYVINTCNILNFTGSRRWKNKLKDLSMHFLDKEIEGSNKEHSSPDCAIVTMELVQLKLAHSVQFGDKVLTRQMDKHILHDTDSRIKHAQKDDNITETENQQVPAILGSEATAKKYIDFASKKNLDKTEHSKSIKIIPCSNNKMVVSTARKVMRDHNYILAHLNYTANDAFDSVSVHQLDKWIRVLYSACPKDTLMTVLFTGNKEHTGAFFVNIKE